MAEEETQNDKQFGNISERFTRTKFNSELASNTKEDFEVLTELFVGNDLFEEAKAVHDVKLMKIIDMILDSILVQYL